MILRGLATIALLGLLGLNVMLPSTSLGRRGTETLVRADVESHVVPGDRPTACAFGGRDLGTLFVTTEAGYLYKVQDSGRKGLAR